MGDEGAAACPPAPKRLKRVAEVVMVLSAMAQMRGGRDPTPVERAMAAEAKETLTKLCEGFRPKDLFPKEAIPALTEELGLRKDAGIGFRGPRVPIADRILQTKRKLEGPKEVPKNQYYLSQHVPVSFGASPISVPGGVHHMQTVSSVQTRRSHMNEKAAAVNVSNPSPAIPHNVPSQPKPNGMAHLAQARVPKAANPQVLPDQKEKTVDHTSLRMPSAPHGMRPVQNNEVKPHAVQPGPANLLIGLPAPQGITYVPAQSVYSSHADISKKVQQIIQAKRDSTHPSWTPPSSDYMNKPLICQACNAVVTDVDSLLICDACERGTHLRCLEANGTKVQVPKAEWHCRRCLALSHGKALPPKYGKVTRTLGTAKAVPALRKENPQLKDDQKKTVPNGVVMNQPNTGPVVNSGNAGPVVNSGNAGPVVNSGNGNNVQVASSNPKEHTVTPSAGTGVKTEGGTGVKSDGASVKSEVGAAINSEAAAVVKTESQHSQNGQSDKLITDGPKQPLAEKEIALPDQHQVDKDSNEENGVAASEKSVCPEVCWVGGAGEVIDGKSYYSSCCIDKTTYKLQDHVLISSDGGRFIPSKIKSLWESKERGSKLAVVNPYYLPSDLPESVSCSSGGVEENEVYASDNKETISISLISGPCEVLRSDRFQEENDKRNQLTDSNDNLPPIFLCRWKYDDTNGILRPLTN